MLLRGANISYFAPLYFCLFYLIRHKRKTLYIVDRIRNYTNLDKNPLQNTVLIWENAENRQNLMMANLAKSTIIIW